MRVSYMRWMLLSVLVSAMLGASVVQLATDAPAPEPQQGDQAPVPTAGEGNNPVPAPGTEEGGKSAEQLGQEVFAEPGGAAPPDSQANSDVLPDAGAAAAGDDDWEEVEVDEYGNEIVPKDASNATHLSEILEKPIDHVPFGKRMVRAVFRAAFYIGKTYLPLTAFLSVFVSTARFARVRDSRDYDASCRGVFKVIAWVVGVDMFYRVANNVASYFGKAFPSLMHRNGSILLDTKFNGIELGLVRIAIAVPLVFYVGPNETIRVNKDPYMSIAMLLTFFDTIVFFATPFLSWRGRAVAHVGCFGLLAFVCIYFEGAHTTKSGVVFGVAAAYQLLALTIPSTKGVDLLIPKVDYKEPVSELVRSSLATCLYAIFYRQLPSIIAIFAMMILLAVHKPLVAAVGVTTPAFIKDRVALFFGVGLERGRSAEAKTRNGFCEENLEVKMLIIGGIYIALDVSLMLFNELFSRICFRQLKSRHELNQSFMLETYVKNVDMNVLRIILLAVNIYHPHKDALFVAFAVYFADHLMRFVLTFFGKRWHVLGAVVGHFCAYHFRSRFGSYIPMYGRTFQIMAKNSLNPARAKGQSPPPLTVEKGSLRIVWYTYILSVTFALLPIFFNYRGRPLMVPIPADYDAASENLTLAQKRILQQMIDEQNKKKLKEMEAKKQKEENIEDLPFLEAQNLPQNNKQKQGAPAPAPNQGSPAPKQGTPAPKPAPAAPKPAPAAPSKGKLHGHQLISRSASSKKTAAAVY